MEGVDCFESAKESPYDAEVVSQDQAGEGGGSRSLVAWHERSDDARPSVCVCLCV